MSGALDLEKFRDWGAPAFVIAEAGVNHGGDLSVALRMIEAAARAGVDAVKFQTYKAARLATRASAAYWDESKEPIATQYELFARYDRFEDADYRRLAEACEEQGVAFLSTPFDDQAVALLDALVPAFKVASADITNFPLLERIANTGKPVLLSTGAATLAEVESTLAFLEGNGSGPVAILHCVLSYPTEPEDASIAALRALGEAFPDRSLGYSDHTAPPASFAAISAAYTLGARIIEKHFTLDKTLPGNDHYHAFDPEDFRRLISELSELRTMLGQPQKDVLEVERPARTHARRSLVARGDIARGALVTAEMLDVKRPGTGIEPALRDRVVGRRAAVDIPDDTTLEWDMLVDGDGAGA